MFGIKRCTLFALLSPLVRFITIPIMPTVWRQRLRCPLPFLLYRNINDRSRLQFCNICRSRFLLANVFKIITDVWLDFPLNTKWIWSVEAVDGCGLVAFQNVLETWRVGYVKWRWLWTWEWLLNVDGVKWRCIVLFCFLAFVVRNVCRKGSYLRFLLNLERGEIWVNASRMNDISDKIRNNCNVNRQRLNDNIASLNMSISISEGISATGYAALTRSVSAIHSARQNK